MRIIRSSWRTRSVTTAVISHTLRRCSMASRRTSDAIPTKYRPMPATARQPISAPSAGEGSKVTSLPADRSMEPSRPPPPDRPSPVRHSLGWLSGSDARGIVAVTDYASRWSSRYSEGLGSGRVPAVPVARDRQGDGRMGSDLHHSQPSKARKGCGVSTSHCYRHSQNGTKQNRLLDVAIRDLQDIEAHWATELGRVRLAECLAMLRHCLQDCDMR